MYQEVKVLVKVNRLLISKVADTAGLLVISSNIVYSELNNFLHELWASNIQSPLVRVQVSNVKYINVIVSQRLVRLFKTGDIVYTCESRVWFDVPLCE